jgi:hypothetical protein
MYVIELVLDSCDFFEVMVLREVTVLYIAGFMGLYV